MAKFLDLGNAKIIRYEIDDAYLRKSDYDSSLKASEVFDLKQINQNISIDNIISDSDFTISKELYDIFNSFASGAAVNKYISDKNNYYPIILSEFNLNETSKTPRILILLNSNTTMYYMWAEVINNIYYLRTQLFYDIIPVDVINNLEIPEINNE